jgi:hypothetical protein
MKYFFDFCSADAKCAVSTLLRSNIRGCLNCDFNLIYMIALIETII